MLQFVSRLENRSVHLLHGISKLDTEPTENVALPCVIFRVHARLDLFVVNDTDNKGLLSLGGVKGRSSLLYLRQELLPAGQGVSKAVEDIVGFKIPKRLELKPFGDVFLQLLHFALDQRKWPIECASRKAS